MSDAHNIEVLEAPDGVWVKLVWRACKHILGGPSPWHRWLSSGAPNEHFVGVRPIAFAHYRERRDGVRVLYNIGVAPGVRRRGLGRALLEHMGSPIELKTDAADPVSNAFYTALGFTRAGSTETKAGKPMHIYRRGDDV